MDENTKDEALKELKKKLQVLIKEYEKFFSGMRKIEPLRERNDLKRALGNYKPVQTRQTFMAGQLRQSFNSYSLLWDKEIQKLLGER